MQVPASKVGEVLSTRASPAGFAGNVPVPGRDWRRFRGALVTVAGDGGKSAARYAELS